MDRVRERERERESKTAQFAYTESLTVRIFCEPLPLCSPLSRDWYRATSRHRIVLASPHFSTFASLELSQALSTSQPGAVWNKARAPSDVTSSSCFPVYFVSVGYIIFQEATQILMVTRGYISFSYAIHAIYVALQLGKHLRSVHFRKQVYFLFCFCSSVWLPSSIPLSQFTRYVKRDLQVNIQQYLSPHKQRLVSLLVSDVCGTELRYIFL